MPQHASKEAALNHNTEPQYAAIYARVSTEDQGEGFSIPTQIDAGQKLAAHEGYTFPDSHVLIDEGTSGTTMERTPQSVATAGANDVHGPRGRELVVECSKA
jgi:hypothetical protein